VSPSQAIVTGIAADGGLFVPEQLPRLAPAADTSYNEHAFRCISPYLPDFDAQELRSFIGKAYAGFDTPDVAPLKSFGNLHFLELFHGKTLAFKDVALSLLPHLMTAAASKIGDSRKRVILTATSGDTGKAALEGFKDVDGVLVIVFYPEHGTSVLQQRMMTTQEGGNVAAIGVRGNFDDAQGEVKRIFADRQLAARLDAQGFALSSANSINIGRLVPQIAYYYHAYAQLVGRGMTPGEEVSFVVPTGNFGNILAGWYAKQMGLPVKKLICASNENNVLTDFLATGVFDPGRPFVATISPSMDILHPSNLERLLFYALGKSPESLLECLNRLNTHGQYSVNANFSGLAGFSADEQATRQAIRRVYDRFGYVIDPHTAVAYSAYEQYDGGEPTVIMSTASPYKFTKSVMSVLDPASSARDDFELLQRLAEFRRESVPPRLAGIADKPVLHDQTVDIAEMKDALLRVLNIYSTHLH